MFQIKKYRKQWILGLSFGLSCAVITTLGIIVGLYAATLSKSTVMVGILVMAISHGLADAFAMHLSEEAELDKGIPVHNKQEIWMTTLFTFLFTTCFSLVFIIPFLFLSLNNAVLASILLGIVFLVVLNFYIAKLRREKPVLIISEHIGLALLVIVLSYWIGQIFSINHFH